MSAYTFWKYIHIVGVLGFIASHGTSASLTFVLRKERDPARIRAVLDLSRSGRTMMYASLVVLVTAGVATALIAGYSLTSGWILASVVTLLILLFGAFPLAVPYYMRIRRAVGSGPGGENAQPLPAEEFDALLRSRRAIVIFLVETIGVLMIVWWMVTKKI